MCSSKKKKKKKKSRYSIFCKKNIYNTYTFVFLKSWNTFSFKHVFSILWIVTHINTLNQPTKDIKIIFDPVQWLYAKNYKIYVMILSWYLSWVFKIEIYIYIKLKDCRHIKSTQLLASNTS